MFSRPLSALFLLFTCASCGPSSEAPKEQSYLRIATTERPASLDPRLVRNLASSTVMRLLFEGLMRTAIHGEIVPGIAESYTLSDDHKTYIFHLRPTIWEDGSPLTASDFEHTWKSVLSPSFPAPNAYQLYMIKGAKAAKEGKGPIDAVGVSAPNPSTLVVELEHPTPYFLKMVACHFFFPVHPSVRSENEEQEQHAIGNGPFKLHSSTTRGELRVEKNPAYWDAKQVNLAGVSLQVLDEHTAFQLFKAGELDWAGSPLSTMPQDTVAILKKENQLQITPGAGTHWFRLNTHTPPFDNAKMRQAFAMALDRQSIVDHVLQGNQRPAIGIVPPSFHFSDGKYYADHDFDKARHLFEQALAEDSRSKYDLSPITLSYPSNDRNHKIAQVAQQQWNKAFGIEVLLRANEHQVQLDMTKKGNYAISLGGWYADIDDPVNFLDLFKYRDNPTNMTFWHNERYAALLDLSATELDPQARLNLLADAEKILMDEMPVIPLFFASYNYVKNPHVTGVYFSPLGYLDFKEAKLENSSKALP